MAKPINLGDIARDTITGFKGVVIARTQWLMGCDRLVLQPQELGKDGKPVESMSFDVGQLELVKAAKAQPMQDTGGPRPEPRRR